jgi:3-oxoacyl-[acyl-carrier protein] reductase
MSVDKSKYLNRVEGHALVLGGSGGLGSEIHMMKIFAEHYAPAGIRINAVAPGWIDTSMNDTLPEDERSHEMSKIWVGRFAHPHEIAAFVAFVSGSGSSYAYGQNFMVDGGYR